MGKVLLLFIGAGLLEIFVFIEVGAAIGAWSTIALILLTAIAGISLVRIQGLQTLMAAQTKINRGETPAREMVSGMMLALSGVLLLLPGFVTDFAGILLLLPPVRHALAERFLSRTHVRGDKGHTFSAEYYYHAETRLNDGEQDRKGVTFEGEAERKDDK